VIQDCVEVIWLGSTELNTRDAALEYVLVSIGLR
jgi:hypothetical protein